MKNKTILFDNLKKSNHNNLVLAKPGSGYCFQIDHKKILIIELLKRIKAIKENKC